MTDTRVLSNKRVTVLIGLDTAVSSFTQPTLAETQALLNVSTVVRWQNFDFNLSASSQEDDRGLGDEADAKSRSYVQFGGAITFFTPADGDTTSLAYQARQLVKNPRTKLVVAIRTIALNSVAPAAGDVWNFYHVITDANAHGRGKVSYSYSVKMVPQDDCGLNVILSPLVPVAVAITPSAPLAATVGTPFRMTAAYQGSNITTAATWVSSAPLIVSVSKHGIGIPISAGTASITATYPGSAAGTPRVITVT